MSSYSFKIFFAFYNMSIQGVRLFNLLLQMVIFIIIQQIKLILFVSLKLDHNIKKLLQFFLYQIFFVNFILPKKHFLNNLIVVFFVNLLSSYSNHIAIG